MVERTGKKRICLIMRAPLARYPSSIFQAELLAEAGYDVWILDTEDGGYRAAELPTAVNRKILSRTDYSWRRKLPFLAPWRRLSFSLNLRRQLMDIRPHLAIVYEPPAMAALGRLLRKQKLVRRVVWHFHEYPEVGPGLGPGTRRDVEYARGHADAVDLVIFPDAHRAAAFQEDVGIRNPPVIAMNCPRRVESLPEADLRRRLDSRFAGSGCVLYLGTIGPNRGIDEAVRSMPHWPAGAVFVLMGPCSGEFREKMLALARSCNSADRIVFLDPVDPRELWSVRRGADVAITMMVEGENTRSLWLRFSAGASNKRFEAMAAGVAQVTNTGAGIEEIIVNTRCGLAVDPSSAEELGAAIRRLLDDSGLRAEMGRNARSEHLQQFNYETQFAPVMARLEDIV